MQALKIKLTDIEALAKIINICTKYNEDIDICDGRCIVDGKSILGVFSLSPDKNKTFKAVIHTEDNNITNKFHQDMKEFKLV